MTSNPFVLRYRNCLVWSAMSSGPCLGDDEPFADSIPSAIEERHPRPFTAPNVRCSRLFRGPNPSTAQLENASIDG